MVVTASAGRHTSVVSGEAEGDRDGAAKVHMVKAMIFPVVKYECESWTIKKAEY